MMAQIIKNENVDPIYYMVAYDIPVYPVSRVVGKLL